MKKQAGRRLSQTASRSLLRQISPLDAHGRVTLPMGLLHRLELRTVYDSGQY